VRQRCHAYQFYGSNALLARFSASLIPSPAYTGDQSEKQSAAQKKRRVVIYIAAISLMLHCRTGIRKYGAFMHSIIGKQSVFRKSQSASTHP
jgi:hypothetical protein